MTLNLIEAVKTVAYNTKLIQNTKIYFAIHFPNPPYCSKTRQSFESAFPFVFMARLETICLTVSAISF